MPTFAIIPAAGESSRMGQPKLLLPWRGRCLVEHGLLALKQGGVDQTFIVLRPDSLELAAVCEAAGATVLTLQSPTPDMKATVAFGLQQIGKTLTPTAADAWLLAPADQPRLSANIVRQLVLVRQHQLLAPPNSLTHSILVPTLAGTRGHPVLFPWALAERVFSLPPQQGINALLQEFYCTEISCDHLEPAGISVFEDVDTPQDYQQLNKNAG